MTRPNISDVHMLCTGKPTVGETCAALFPGAVAQPVEQHVEGVPAQVRCLPAPLLAEAIALVDAQQRTIDARRWGRIP